MLRNFTVPVRSRFRSNAAILKQFFFVPAEGLHNWTGKPCTHAIGLAKRLPQAEGLTAIKPCNAGLHVLRQNGFPRQRQLGIQNHPGSSGGIAGGSGMQTYAALCPNRN